MVKKQQQSNKQNPNDQKQKIRLFLAGSRILDLQHSRLGTLSKDDDDGSETVGKKKRICVLSKLIASIWTCSISTSSPGLFPQKMGGEKPWGRGWLNM